MKFYGGCAQSVLGALQEEFQIGNKDSFKAASAEGLPDRERPAVPSMVLSRYWGRSSISRLRCLPLLERLVFDPEMLGKNT